jgi:Right handed beta helix region
MTDPKHDPEHLERSLRSWMTDQRPSLADRDMRINEILGSLDHAPQTRARFLGRWFPSGGGARRRAEAHDHPPNTNRRTSLMFSVTGVAAAIAILALSVNVIDRAPLHPGAIASTYLVGSSASAEFDSIQAAVDAAADGDRIEIEPGEYIGSVTIDKDITIVGDTTDPTRVIVVIPVDGPQVEMWDHRMNYAFELVDVEASIGGLSVEGPGLRTTAFVIRGGNPTVHDVDVQLAPLQSWPRAFAYVDDQARGEIRDSATNAAISIGGGSIMRLSGNTTMGPDATNGFVIIASGELTEVDVADTRVNAINIDSGAHASVSDSEIVAANGCGIDITGNGTDVVAIGNVVRTNETGICTSGRASATIEDNDVFANETGISLGSDGAMVRSNDVRGNDVGVLVRVGSPTIEGNTITQNRAGLAFGSLPATPELDGNAFCDNEMSVEVPGGIEAPSLDGNEVC